MSQFNQLAKRAGERGEEREREREREREEEESYPTHFRYNK